METNNFENEYHIIMKAILERLMKSILKQNYIQMILNLLSIKIWELIILKMHITLL